ncbi:Negative regulator of systemic acquired resistance SNI1 [Linum grandiflorum]
MESVDPKRRGNRIVEENFLAIFEADDSRDTRENHDDRIAFLEAVRSSCLAPENGSSPTKKMYQAVYEILRAGKSLELIMQSFWLLSELNKVVSASESKELQLVMADEVWSPFVLNSDAGSAKKQAVKKNSIKPLDSLAFHLLVKELIEVATIESPQIQSLRTMLLFQYLVDVLEGDFMPRNKLFEETSNWVPVRESLLNLHLSSRKMQFKTFIRDCLTAFCGLSDPSIASEADHDATMDVEESESSAAAAIVWAEVKNNTCTALQKLLVAIMEFDVSRKVAEAQGSTTRADGVRTPLVELVLDELIYDSEMLSPFLQRFNEPKWKSELILQYLQKYVPNPSVRTRRSNSPPEDHTISGILKGLSNLASSKSIAKKIGTDAVQLLIAHAFQAHLSLCSSKQDGEETTDVAEMCEDVIAAFNTLQTADQKLEIQAIGREALFTAAMILSTKTEEV